MNVIYKVYLNERVSDVRFPNLKREFRREIVEENCENPHVSLLKYHSEPGICYSVGKVK